MPLLPASPRLALNNGTSIPALGFGALGREMRDLTAPAVETALATGYRLIDTAAAYLNERDVGEALARSGIDRSHIFVTTKLWIGHYGYDRARRAFDVSLQKLGLDYVDLYLLHWPVPSDFETTIASYKALETLLSEGRTRAIGVSNFTPAQLKTLMDRTEVPPALNQVELHPSFQQRELREVHQRLGILTQAWGPIGGSIRRFAGDRKASDPLQDPAIAGLAAKHAKTPAQIVLRWHIQNGIAAIPKSFTPSRIAENFNIFDFALSADDMAAIDALDTGERFGPDPDVLSPSTTSVKLED